MPSPARLVSFPLVFSWKTGTKPACEPGPSAPEAELWMPRHCEAESLPAVGLALCGGSGIPGVGCSELEGEPVPSTAPAPEKTNIEKKPHKLGGHQRLGAKQAIGRPGSPAARALPDVTWWVGHTCSWVPYSLLLPWELQKCQDVSMATPPAGGLAWTQGECAFPHLVPRRPSR